jgi:hypothetical protein
MVTGRLLATIAAATERWGIGLEAIDHVIWPDEEPLERPGSFVQAEMRRLREESSLQ